jgi:hypothetical protein
MGSLKHDPENASPGLDPSWGAQLANDFARQGSPPPVLPMGFAGNRIARFV